MTRFPLTIAVDATHSLGVMARVPGSIEHDHAVRPDQVHAQTTSPEVQRGQQSGTVCHHQLVLPDCNISHAFILNIRANSCVSVCYLVDKRKTQAEVLDGSLNWFISRSLSEAVVLPSSPLRYEQRRA